MRRQYQATIPAPSVRVAGMIARRNEKADMSCHRLEALDVARTHLSVSLGSY